MSDLTRLFSSSKDSYFAFLLKSKGSTPLREYLNSFQAKPLMWEGVGTYYLFGRNLQFVGSRRTLDTLPTGTVDYDEEEIDRILKLPPISRITPNDKEIVVVVKVTVTTNQSAEEVISGIKKGIYRGLDSPPTIVAPPSDVSIKVQVIQESEDEDS